MQRRNEGNRPRHSHFSNHQWRVDADNRTHQLRLLRNPRNGRWGSRNSLDGPRQSAGAACTRVRGMVRTGRTEEQIFRQGI